MNTYVEWVLLPKSLRVETFTVTRVLPHKNDTIFQLTDQAILVHGVRERLPSEHDCD